MSEKLYESRKVCFQNDFESICIADGVFTSGKLYHLLEKYICKIVSKFIEISLSNDVGLVICLTFFETDFISLKNSIKSCNNMKKCIINEGKWQ